MASNVEARQPLAEPACRNQQVQPIIAQNAAEQSSECCKCMQLYGPRSYCVNDGERQPPNDGAVNADTSGLSEKTVQRMMCSSLLLGVAISVSVVVFAYGRPAVGPTKEPSDPTYVDLSYAYDADTVYWPTLPRFELKKFFEGDMNGSWVSMNTFCASEHGGTHVDAPNHFAKGKLALDELGLDRFAGPAAVVNISAKAASDPDSLLTMDDVTAYEKEHGSIPKGAFVFMFSDWGRRWPDRLDYLGNNRTDILTPEFHFPGFDPEAVDFLIKNRDIHGIGSDTASLDYGLSANFPTHKILAEANLVGFEMVANLDQLPASGAQIYALPIKIKGGTGGPTRIMGIIPGK